MMWNYSGIATVFNKIDNEDSQFTIKLSDFIKHFQSSFAKHFELMQLENAFCVDQSRFPLEKISQSAL